jgi:hypothetical protein
MAQVRHRLHPPDDVPVTVAEVRGVVRDLAGGPGVACITSAAAAFFHRYGRPGNRGSDDGVLGVYGGGAGGA